MNDKNTGGPAFPHHFTHESIGDCQGMTLRDYFAAQAMVGLIQRLETRDQVAKSAYAIADKMLEAREK